ncbi:hypothetical protein SSX86_017664 [Deinandra increscens subsp. villosa]|uniref:SAMT n=1 Tax=Deinandra increscens subsp. villosa TaxID=3103831 RepID=A0AAP0GX95_9ASTR
MSVVNILHMNHGDGESSYANNSFLQENVIRKVAPLLKSMIKGMAEKDVFDNCFMAADLGCSSSPNTLLVISNIIDAVEEVCHENSRKSPQFQVCLNDLSGNDFNKIFELLPEFFAKLEKEKGQNFGPCFVYGVPGSFYGRLFPNESLHLVHSTNSLHWLSQVPKGLGSTSLNVYITKTSPPNVIQAYEKQFHNDFTKFLQMRSKEMVHGGRMIFTLTGRSIVDPTSDDCCCLWDLFAQSLIDMLEEGLVRESDIKSFNIPVYTPCEEQVKNIVKCEGSFSIDEMSGFKINWDPYDTDYTSTNSLNKLSHSHGKNTAKVIRALIEPLLSSHFGNSIIDVLFDKYGNHVARHLSNKKTRHFNMVVSLTKK